MELRHGLAIAVLEGATGVLPLSASGHRVAAAIWLGSDRELDAVIGVAELGTLVAVLATLRQRLAGALAAAIRGIARPAVLQTTEGGRDATAITVGATTALLGSLVVGGAGASLNATPMVAGVGLLMTAAALLSTTLAPAPDQLTPRPATAAVAGLAFTLAIVPGASPICAAFVIMRWSGVSTWRAAEMALMLGIPLAIVGAVRLFASGGLDLLVGAHIALALVAAFVSAKVALGWLRTLCERRREARLALWLLPLSLALFAYERALPEPRLSPPYPHSQVIGERDAATAMRVVTAEQEP